MTAHRRPVRQLIAGIVALPLSLVPFAVYATSTPEGRLVADRVIVALRPPSLPEIPPARARAIAAQAPSYADGVMVLAYHGIGSSDAEGGFVITPDRFAEHLATLRAAGMHTVTAADLARAFAGGKPLPPKAVMITFDDGRADAMLYADPLLADAKMRATMFVITGAASHPGAYYASWADIGRYARSGRWDIESHTASLHHEQEVAGGRMLPALTSLAAGESPAEYRTRIASDLDAANTAIAEHTGRKPVAFAYPFGAYGADRTNDPSVRTILAAEVARRYAVAFHQDDQDTVPLTTVHQAQLGLRRLEVGDWSGAELLRRTAAAAARTAPASRPAIAERAPAPSPVVPALPAVPKVEAPGSALPPGSTPLPPGSTPLPIAPTPLPKTSAPSVPCPVASPVVPLVICAP